MEKKTILVIVCVASLLLLTSLNYGSDAPPLSDATPQSESEGQNQQDPWDRYEDESTYQTEDKSSESVTVVLDLGFGYVLWTFPSE